MDQNGKVSKQNSIREDYVLVVTIVESDFAESALQAAKTKGAEECIIIHGRGKHVGKEESVFNVPLDLPRDLVLALVQKDNANTVQDGVFEAVGLRTEGHGLVYQMPITSLARIMCDGEVI